MRERGLPVKLLQAPLVQAHDRNGTSPHFKRSQKGPDVCALHYDVAMRQNLKSAPRRDVKLHRRCPTKVIYEQRYFVAGLQSPVFDDLGHKLIGEVVNVVDGRALYPLLSMNAQAKFDFILAKSEAWLSRGRHCTWR